ncbi:MAG: TIGR03984 family CRISPR-associated protein [ANME-2 cluster archaeon]|nr:MAG: TIGR03984 family CRISPR-associated protein [ANME-2 cluster archaeon]
MKNKNTLTIFSVRSRTLNLGDFQLSDQESFDSLIRSKFGQPGYCVCYLDHRVLIGKYEDDALQFDNSDLFDPRFILKMRLFNGTQELYLWRKKDTWYSGRLRVDEEGDETDVVESHQVLWGTDYTHKNGFTRIFEERGTELILPIGNLTVDNEDNRVFIKTRNYIVYETNDKSYQQAGYADCRFLAFTDKNENDLGVK